MNSAQDPGTSAASADEASVYTAPRQDKPWGHEVIFAAIEGKYVGKVIHVNAGQSLSLQYHERKEETISLISGEAVMSYGVVGGELTEVKFGPGDTIHLPAGAVHRVTAVSDIVFVESSTAYPGWREDVVRLEDAYGRSGTSAP